MIRSCLALLLAAALGACAAPRVPRPSAARPLLLPSGDQQLRALGGRDFVVHDAGRASDVDGELIVDLEYAVGITERLAWHTPLVFAWRLWRDLGSELAVHGGIDGLGWGEAWLRPSHGDPRQPNRRVSSWQARAAVGASGRHFLRHGLTLQTAVRARQGLFGGRLEDYEAGGSATLIVDVGDSLSLAITAATYAEMDADEARLRRGWTLGGQGLGLVSAPTLALHVRDNVDLVAWSSVDYLQGDGVWRFAAAAGFVWHGRRREELSR